MTDVRVGGTNADQYWRVTGIREGDAPRGVPLPRHVLLETWIEVDGKTHKDWRREVLSFDPDYARQVGQHLIDMADYAEERNVTNLLRYFDTSSRTKHKSIKAVATSIEGLAEYLEEVLPEGSEKTVAMRKLLEAKDAACRSALDLPEE